MPIEFTCPHCGKHTSVADHYAGQTGPCAACGKPITVPPAAGAAAPVVVKSGGGMGTGAIVAIGLAVGGLVILACGGILVAMLLPAVQAAREAARRSSCSNNLKQIGLALHNYHDTYKTFPPAYMTDSAGNPTVSWRVLILPFMESSPLYEQIDTQQPWDSPANAALQNAAVSTLYRCPSAPEGGSDTNYMLITGPGTAFQDGKAPRLSDITDGTSNTILVVEVKGQGVHWAAPQDLDVQTLQIPPNRAGGPGQMGSHHPGGLQVLFADASVRFIPDTINPATMRALITPNGGESVSY